MGMALGLGVFLGVRASVSPSASFALFIIATTGILAAINQGLVRTLLGLVAVGCLLGWTAGTIRGELRSIPYIGESRISIEGVIDSDPAVTQRGMAAWVRWNDEAGVPRRSWTEVTGADIGRRGDTIAFRGTVEGVNGEFIESSLTRVTIPASRLNRARHDVRQWLTSAVRTSVPGSEGTLALGLLIGDDSALPKDDELAVRKAGLSHITAVSGWNVSLVIGAVGLALGALHLRGWFWTSVQLGALFAFVWIVGFDPPVTRAAVMAVVVLAAGRLGRPSHGPTILAIAAGLMLLISPTEGGSLSFQLSFLATAGLIAADRLVGTTGRLGAILKPLVATIAAGMLTAPLLAAQFGNASPVLLPANILAGPLVGLATFAAIATVALSWAGPIAIITGSVTWLLTRTVLLIAHAAASAPFGYLDFGELSPAGASLIYLALAIAVFVVLPEGRMTLRRLRGWLIDEPGPTLLAGASATTVVLLGTVVLAAV